MSTIYLYPRLQNISVALKANLQVIKLFKGERKAKKGKKENE